MTNVKVLFLLLAFLALPAYGQGLNPGYVADTSATVLQWPLVTPNVGAQIKNGAIVKDTSYLTDGLSASSLSLVTRCTDQAMMASTAANQTKTAG